ncbi:hypothetical protein HDK77DRAFT_442144 [Phyllosticta capitalensis]
MPPGIFIPPRYKVVLAVVVFIICSLFLFGSPTKVDHVPSVSEISQAVKNPKIPSISIPQSYNPFVSVHKPPVQANSTSGTSSWFSDWKWRNPFSSSITLDENRAVLPPLHPRTPVYTFYDGDVKQDPAIRRAEERLLLQWRRAWWAQGFKPIVLGRPEALNNPLYKTLQLANLDGTPDLKRLELEFARWLAWGNMGSGILANWLTLPMAPYNDHFLTYLRRGEYPKLTRFESLRTGLYVGQKDAINKAIKAALDNPELQKAKTMIDAIPKDMFTVNPEGDAIAVYDLETVGEKYKDVVKVLDQNGAEGLHTLAQLMNSHLHNTWQNIFDKGISVLKPVPTHMTALVAEAVDLARNLTQCPDSPMPSSCPPNRKCKPCVSNVSSRRIQLMPIYRNDSQLFTIGTVPHPYTFLSLNYQRDTVDAKFLRREVKERDLWLISVTKELLGTGKSASTRISHFKDAVASEHGAHHSIWLTAERESQKDLNWLFGFELPDSPEDDGRSETPVPGPERRPAPPKPAPGEGPLPTQAELAAEQELFDKARRAVKSNFKEMARVKDAVEAWNLADTEAWRFARAFSARRRVERLVWEEEESKFAGAERKKQGSWGRWFDN